MRLLGAWRWMQMVEHAVATNPGRPDLVNQNMAMFLGNGPGRHQAA